MDGFKKRLRESLRLRLSLWLSMAILAIAVIAGVVAFLGALEEADESQDDLLEQIAAVFDRYRLQEVLPPPDAGSPGPTDDGLPLGSYGESGVSILFIPGGIAGRSAPQVGHVETPLLAALPDGMHSIHIRSEPYRVLVKTLASGDRLAVTQATAVRDEIVRASALYAVTPFLVLVPILLLVVAVLVRKMFRPISSLANEIDQRGEQDLQPVAADPLPAEVRPFVTAINRLLDRVARAMDAQRRFVADAAHELRSPLTALSLQAERLSAADMSDAARDQLGTLRKGIDRGRNLLEQLLSLARAQLETPAAAAAVSVRHVYRDVLEDLMPLAEARRVDVGVEGEHDVSLQVHGMDLRTLVKNLVDNAIRYTPRGGRVDLSVREDGHRAILQVRDSGPGIPRSEWERVFDPFFRVLGNDEVGSGLGLSIVKTIASRMGAEVSLAHADEIAQVGLVVTVVIPMDRSASGRRN